MKWPVGIEAGETSLVRKYELDDPIWKLPQEKRERQALADAQRDLAVLADQLAQTKVTERG